MRTQKLKENIQGLKTFTMHTNAYLNLCILVDTCFEILQVHV